MATGWKGTTVLITGGSGTLGHALVPKLLEKMVKTIRIYSRCEQRQEQMAREFPLESREEGRLRFFIGDVRDAGRLRMAMKGVDRVIHAAALKIVPTCAYNPFEVLETNINGSRNVIEAALDSGVERLVAVSTDKAVEPVTLYGASKAFMEQLVVSSNNYRGYQHATLSSLVRYGNVSCSRGSFLPLVLAQRKNGVITITDSRSTRFWLSQDRAVDLIFSAFEHMRGGEIFVPKVPSMRVTDLVASLAPQAEMMMVGLRAQEKVHECLITYEEARRTRDAGEFYVVEPEGPHWAREQFDQWPKMHENFRYTSNGGKEWVKPEQFQQEAAMYLDAMNGKQAEKIGVYKVKP